MKKLYEKSELMFSVTWIIVYDVLFSMAEIMTTNLWNGVTMNVSAAETVLYILSMFCVGFIEEVIFRGLLFKAICKSNVKRAVLISSITFGLGHITKCFGNSRDRYMEY